jgi:endoglucanase
VQGLRDREVRGIDYSIGQNKELEGKTPLAVMDAIITEAGKQGLMIILDSHRLNNKRIPDLWYGDGFTEWDWIRTWAMLAERYKDQPNVIGADLKNEPHGKATWGTGDRRTDWRLAAERGGNAILDINPRWLIFVEGIEENVPGQKLAKHWMGGNLEGVKQWPVRLEKPQQLVYAPHEYGPGLFDHVWFSAPDFPKNMPEVWDTSFFYIAKENIAPIWIGEFGGKLVDRTSKEGQWQNAFVDFVNTNQLGFAYWSWNPNSADTNGILQADWKTPEPAKQTMLDRLLPAPRLKVQTSKISQSHHKYPEYKQAEPKNPEPKNPEPKNPKRDVKPTATTTPTGKLSQLQLQTKLKSDWDTGFCQSLEVRNTGDQAVADWKLVFDMPKATIDQTWNAKYSEVTGASKITGASKGQYEARPVDWGRIVQPQKTIDFGFCAKKASGEKQPFPQNFQIVAAK